MKPGNHSCLIQTGTGAKSCKIRCILENKRVRVYFRVYPCLSVREAFFDAQEISTRNSEGRNKEARKKNIQMIESKNVKNMTKNYQYKRKRGKIT